MKKTASRNKIPLEVKNKQTPNDKNQKRIEIKKIH